MLANRFAGRSGIHGALYGRCELSGVLVQLRARFNTPRSAYHANLEGGFSIDRTVYNMPGQRVWGLWGRYVSNSARPDEPLSRSTILCRFMGHNHRLVTVYAQSRTGGGPPPATRRGVQGRGSCIFCE